MWDLSCPDWEDRIRERRSLIPDLPLNEAEADLALAMFDELHLPDVPGLPKMRSACGQWFRDLVRVAFGSWFPEENLRYIREILAMLPKGQSKTTYSAGLLLVAMLMNKRPRAEGIFVGPTQAIADNAYDKAVGMIDASQDLKRRFRPRDHIKTIEDLSNHTELRVRSFDVNILTGRILFIAMLDELHLLGRDANTAKVLRQIRGGLEKTPEGLLIITTTQSDEVPAGAFKDELRAARKIRDGHFRGKVVRSMLPVLYEFPQDIAKDRVKWSDPENWDLVMPNLGRSVHKQSLIADWETEKAKSEEAIRIWASQHLNIEMGVGLSAEGWRGADHWESAADKSLQDLSTLLARSEVVTFGSDMGGLDDLLGVAVIGRERGTRRWLIWSHALAHKQVLSIRKDIASRLEGFANERSLTLCGTSKDLMTKFGDIFQQVFDSGKLPGKDAVGVDPNNVAAMIEELTSRGMTDAMLRRLRQGEALSPAWWGLEMKLSDGTVSHAGFDLMDWCVGNAKVEPRGNGILITKQISGRAKIDPLIATGCATILMSWNPTAAPRVDLDAWLSQPAMAI